LIFLAGVMAGGDKLEAVMRTPLPGVERATIIAAAALMSRGAAGF
jgi:hypothetical protein